LPELSCHTNCAVVSLVDHAAKLLAAFGTVAVVAELVFALTVPLAAEVPLPFVASTR
jgi:hypothetical protein